MTTSTTRTTFARTAVALAALIVARQVSAEGPHSTVRTFAYLTQTNVETCPNLDADESVALVAHGGRGTDQWIEIWEQSPELAGDRFYTGDTEVTHVTQGGAEHFTLYWLDAPPPNGAIAQTGSDQGAVFLAVYPIRRVTTSEDSLAHANLWTVDNSDTATVLLCVGMGLFSK